MDPLNATAGPPEITAILLQPEQMDAIRGYVASQAPEEACGLLSGSSDGIVSRAAGVIPITNALHSPVRYRMDPQEQLAAFEQIDSAGLELVGIFHSHPNGPPDPSATDLAEAFYPETVYLIWSGVQGSWQCRAFRLKDGLAWPVEILTDQPE